MNSGTTIKSWNINMEKPAWPAGVCRERRSASNCITTAVDDTDSTRPSTMDASSGKTRQYTTMPIRPALATTSPTPAPNTQRRSAHKRSVDNSRPIINIRNITPSSARPLTCSARTNEKYLSQPKSPAHKPKPNGPIRAPTARKPKTWLTFRRCNRGINIPARARNSKVSRRYGKACCSSKIILRKKVIVGVALLFAQIQHIRARVAPARHIGWARTGAELFQLDRGEVGQHVRIEAHIGQTLVQLGHAAKTQPGVGITIMRLQLAQAGQATLCLRRQAYAGRQLLTLPCFRQAGRTGIRRQHRRQHAHGAAPQGV